MMQKLILLFCLIGVTVYAQPSTTNNPNRVKSVFSEKSISEEVMDVNNQHLTIASILEKHKGKVVVLYLWASWCTDCMLHMPEQKKTQEKNKDVVYVSLSADLNENSWRRTIKEHNIKGEHYFFSNGWKNDFTNYLDVDWIPRVLVVDQNGKIVVYNSRNINSVIVQLVLDKLNGKK